MIEMAPSLVLLLLGTVLIGVGLYLVQERSMSRIVIGVALITHGVNVVLLLAGGRAGAPPILGQADPKDMADPLPQAMVLTAIVIGLALTAFLLSMAYRSWQLHGHDEVQDDIEDRRLALLSARREHSVRAEDDDGSSLEDEASGLRDETETGNQQHWMSTSYDSNTAAVTVEPDSATLVFPTSSSAQSQPATAQIDPDLDVDAGIRRRGRTALLAKLRKGGQR